MVKVGISVMISTNLADQYFEMIQFSSTQVILMHLIFYGVLDFLASVIDTTVYRNPERNKNCRACVK